MKQLFMPIGVCLFLNTISAAQTGGPSQPEFTHFQQAGLSGLVNTSTGAFTYQIPLFTIGGYPINLNYQSGAAMEDAAGTTGLGWTLNPGTIVRNLRGLPDDFNGDAITRKINMKPNYTIGAKLDVDVEISGFNKKSNKAKTPDSTGKLKLSLGLGASFGLFYNSYTSWGIEAGLSTKLGACFQLSDKLSVGGNVGLGVNVNSQQGTEKYINPSLSFTSKYKKDIQGTLGKTWSVNSKEGLKTYVNANLTLNQKVPLEATIGYFNNYYNPEIEYPMISKSRTFSAGIGGDFAYVDPSARMTGYFTSQELASKELTFPAYGIMNLQNIKQDNILSDYSREKKLPYIVGESKILPVPYQTPDVFSVNAQNLGLSFSAVRSDLGITGDTRTNSFSNGLQLGVEANFGGTVKAGANLGATINSSTVGVWNGSISHYPAFKDASLSNSFENVHFVSNNELATDDNRSFFNQIDGYNIISYSPTSTETLNAALTDNQKSKRDARATAISYLTADMAGYGALEKKIENYPFNNFSGQPVLIDRLGQYRKENHLSEITILQPDGMNYVFGIPVYNITQTEATFNTSQLPDPVTGLVNYVQGAENSINNNAGVDNFFESTTTPAYATTFLITALLSPDYRDMTNNGPTEDDHGNYVKFNYSKEAYDYRWRNPVSKGSFNSGFRSDANDNKGSYVYGEKELWYIHSIVSKTEIAEFFYSYRDDALGVLGENGGKDVSDKLRKLDSIRIFIKKDKEENPLSAVPLKVINLAYEYELCKGAENNLIPGAGKLTLKKISFTSERSKKGLLTPYTFSYGDMVKNNSLQQINPDYNHRNVNRWGQFQPGTGTSDLQTDLPGTVLSNTDFPYSSQDRPFMNENAYAWNLTVINTPAGGKIKVEYEANDYAYVQDKPAMQMMMVRKGFGASLNAANNSFYSGIGSLQNSGYSRLYFSLPNPITASSDAEANILFRNSYLKDIPGNYLYYKFYVSLQNQDAEFVSGYAKVAGSNNDYGVEKNALTGRYETGFITLVNEYLNEDKTNLGTCNPILKNALQFLRINRNSYVFGNTGLPPAPTDILTFIQQFPSIRNQLKDQRDAARRKGMNYWMMDTKNFCQAFNPDYSFIKLYNPVKSKISGGSRVSKISIDDAWDIMTDNTQPAKSYSLAYSYTTTEANAVTGKKDTISSGVADYEPMVGGDEIPQRKPIFYTDRKVKAPDNQFFVEEPINESLFPAPQIIYSKVTQVSNPENNTVAKTGKTVYEYYTAKDYPVKTAKTNVFLKRSKSKYTKFKLPYFPFDPQKDYVTVAQGYAVYLNDMSGKSKATWNYDEKGALVSGEKTEYFDNNDDFTILDSLGKINRHNRLGVRYAVTIDGREFFDQTTSPVLQVNVNIGPSVAYVPSVVPLPSVMTEEKRFRSMAVNKVFNRNGIIKKRIVYSQTASVTTENLLFDGYTGNPLVTRTTNEFNDSIYNTSLPAWIVYPLTGPAYRNINTSISTGNLSAWMSTASSQIRPFNIGDEFCVTQSMPDNRVWLSNYASPGFLGSPSVSSSTNLILKNSSLSNQLNLVAGTIVTTKTPITAAGNDLQFTNIINAEMNEYHPFVISKCVSCEETAKGGIRNQGISNPFLSLISSWKPFRSWTYLTDRKYSLTTPGSTAIRKDGVYANFSLLWKRPAATSLYALPNPVTPGWQWKEANELYDYSGSLFMTKNALNIHSSSQLGYNKTLVTAQASNAKWFDFGFDSFEELKKTEQDTCLETQLLYMEGKKQVIPAFLNDQFSHTGRYSLELRNNLVIKRHDSCLFKTTLHLQFADIITDSLFAEFIPLATTMLTPAMVSPGSRLPVPDFSVDRLLAASPALTQRVNTSPTGSCFCLDRFTPVPGKKYIFSAWVLVNKPQPVYDYSEITATITGATSVPLQPSGQIIEGWQRIYGEFTGPADISDFRIEITKSTFPTYIDDIRIHPAEGNMKGFVYDNRTLKLTSTLDENNFFTRYQYDKEGNLERILKETEKGIITISEGRQSNSKH